MGTQRRAWRRVRRQILARIQFAGALASAVESRLASLDALVEAAGYLAADQHLDGSWRLDASESIGSPATYGLALATASARRTLADAGDPRLQPAVARADRWLRGSTSRRCSMPQRSFWVSSRRPMRTPSASASAALR